MVVRAKATLLREKARRAGGWRRCPSADRRRTESARVPAPPACDPFAAFSAAFGAFAPHANVGYQWNGKSVLAGDVYADVKGDLPDQFIYALGSDLSVNPATSASCSTCSASA